MMPVPGERNEEGVAQEEAEVSAHESKEIGKHSLGLDADATVPEKRAVT